MRTVSVSQLKAQLSRYLREVRRGGEVQIMDRGRPIARLSPLSQTGEGDEHRDRLIASGVLRAGSQDVTEFLDAPPGPADADVGGALRDDRDDRV